MSRAGTQMRPVRTRRDQDEPGRDPDESGRDPDEPGRDPDETGPGLDEQGARQGFSLMF